MFPSRIFTQLFTLIFSHSLTQLTSKLFNTPDPKHYNNKTGEQHELDTSVKTDGNCEFAFDMMSVLK